MFFFAGITARFRGKGNAEWYDYAWKVYYAQDEIYCDSSVMLWSKGESLMLKSVLSNLLRNLFW